MRASSQRDLPSKFIASTLSENQESGNQRVELIGVDFSGNADQWRPTVSRPNVWVAFGISGAETLKVSGLVPVQDLPGPEAPFLKLRRLFAERHGSTCAIDAPFSLPSQFVGEGTEQVWRRTSMLPRENRPFCRGGALVQALASDLPPRGKKIYRDTETHWIRKGVNTRSTTWYGPRGGAPFAAACMSLLAGHEGAVWPFQKNGLGATLCEAFPAAQLRHWGLPHRGYSEASRGATVRRLIVAALEERHELDIPPDLRTLCFGSADSLDVVICLYAARAVGGSMLASDLGPSARAEGWIAIHR